MASKQAEFLRLLTRLEAVANDWPLDQVDMRKPVLLGAMKYVGCQTTEAPNALSEEVDQVLLFLHELQDLFNVDALYHWVDATKALEYLFLSQISDDALGVSCMVRASRRIHVLETLEACFDDYASQQT